MDLILLLRSSERILIVLAGILCIYLGYLLFVKGLSGEATLKAQYDKSKIQLVNAAPGIFFVLFGAVILITVAVNNLVLDVPRPASPITQDLLIQGDSLKNLDDILKSTDIRNVEGILVPGSSMTEEELRGAIRIRFWIRSTEDRAENSDSVVTE